MTIPREFILTWDPILQGSDTQTVKIPGPDYVFKAIKRKYYSLQ